MADIPGESGHSSVRGEVGAVRRNPPGFRYREIVDFPDKRPQNRVVCGLVLTLHDGIEHAAFFYGHIVLKNWLAVETEPCVGGTGNGNLNFGVVLHILVNILLVVGAKPQFSILL